jgi:hypothetical protein
MTLVCETASAAQMRTTLYFGMTRPTGAVSELEWQMFLRDAVLEVIRSYRKAFDQESVLWETARVCGAS